MKKLFYLFFLISSLIKIPQIQASPMKITDIVGEFGGLLRLPCDVGFCVLDTGGRGGGLMTLNNETVHFPKFSDFTVETLRGPLLCDLLSPQFFTLAEKQIYTERMIRCKEFPENLSPMLGTDFLQSQKFSFIFSNSTFLWEFSSSEIENQTLDFSDHWITMNGFFNKESVHIVFDTGAPMTLVDEDFVQENPSLFTPFNSSVPNVKLVLPNEKLYLGNQELAIAPMMVVPIKKTFKVKTIPQFMLGMNLIKLYDWHFNLETNEFWFRSY